jgi:arylsulfatase A-like enzyme/Tfp pilus assembly protein PilF
MKKIIMLKTLRRLAFLLTAVACSSLILGRLPAYSSPAENLNLLVITIDTLRADHLGIYGYAKVKTPNIDRLGEKGILFKNAFSHVPLTLPSHCSLFSGTLPLFHGVRDNGYRLLPSTETLAEILKNSGYQTAAFVGAFPLDSRFGLNKGFDVYDDLYGSKNVIRDLTFVERKAEDVNRKVLEWLARNREKKFFMWVHYFDLHAPYEPPSPFKEEYMGREYDGEIAYTDAAVGALLEKLDQWKLMDRTLVILTADHGEALGEHQETTHGIFVYDSTLRVPLVFFNSKIFPAKKVVSCQAGLIDIAPTILDLLGLPKNPKMQGASLKPFMLKGKSRKEATCYIESIAAMMDRNWAPLQGLRTAEWKYIEAPIPELYDLRNDPQETNNIIKANPDQARRLQQKLKSLIQSYSSPAASQVLQTERDKETREKLMSLGYVSGKALWSESKRPDPKTMIAQDNLFNDAIIASESGNLEMADRLYKEVIQKQPNFIVGYEYSAYNYYKMGKLDEAVNLLRRAVNLNLSTTSLISRLGLYLQEAGRLEESIQILEKAVVQDPNYTEAYNYLGVSYFKNGQAEKAVEAFKKAINLDDDYAMAMNNLANCYLALKEYDMAIEEYKKAIDIDARLASAYNGWGAACYRKGLTDEALIHWKKSLELDPRQPDTSYNLGRAHLRLGHKKEALKFLERFIQTASPQKYEKDIEEVKGVIERLKREIRESGIR